VHGKRKQSKEEGGVSLGGGKEIRCARADLKGGKVAPLGGRTLSQKRGEYYIKSPKASQS